MHRETPYQLRNSDSRSGRNQQAFSLPSGCSTNLDAAAQYIHQNLPLEAFRVILSSQRIPFATLSLSTVIVLRVLDLSCLIVRRTERPNGVHPVSVFPQVLATSLPRAQVLRPVLVLETSTHFMCLHLGGREGSSVDPFKLWGGSMTIDEDDRSGVFLSLTMNAWPP